ncbi:hypothetical protein CRG98_019498 [Punica granatum]|uniref:Uncharacterized protein n=1 Tax=Punica granatum TaxID=22663 RepID=A0A2I0JW37_PUNGR|nr:hypothetical protein CRG98_019498 [Punica granatum]
MFRSFRASISFLLETAENVNWIYYETAHHLISFGSFQTSRRPIPGSTNLASTFYPSAQSHDLDPSSPESPRPQLDPATSTPRPQPRPRDPQALDLEPSIRPQTKATSPCHLSHLDSATSTSAHLTQTSPESPRSRDLDSGSTSRSRARPRDPRALSPI